MCKMLVIYQNSCSLDISSIIDVKASKSISTPDGVWDPAIVWIWRPLAILVFGSYSGNVGIDWHVLRHGCAKEETVKPEKF